MANFLGRGEGEGEGAWYRDAVVRFFAVKIRCCADISWIHPETSVISNKHMPLTSTTGYARKKSLRYVSSKPSTLLANTVFHMLHIVLQLFSPSKHFLPLSGDLCHLSDIHRAAPKHAAEDWLAAWHLHETAISESVTVNVKSLISHVINDTSWSSKQKSANISTVLVATHSCTFSARGSHLHARLPHPYTVQSMFVGPSRTGLPMSWAGGLPWTDKRPRARRRS